jgi:hypothetical protein
VTAERPSADAALAVVAPHGVLQEKVLSRLDVRCRCTELLVRVLGTPAGLLAVARHHHGPTPKMLRAKGDGWPGGSRQERRVIEDERGVRVADHLGAHVGWYEDPAWLLPDGPEHGQDINARCRCGARLSGAPGEVARLLQAAIGTGIRTLRAPDNLLRASNAG